MTELKKIVINPQTKHSNKKFYGNPQSGTEPIETFFTTYKKKLPKENQQKIYSSFFIMSDEEQYKKDMNHKSEMKPLPPPIQRRHTICGASGLGIGLHQNSGRDFLQFDKFQPNLQLPIIKEEQDDHQNNFFKSLMKDNHDDENDDYLGQLTAPNPKHLDQNFYGLRNMNQQNLIKQFTGRARKNSIDLHLPEEYMTHQPHQQMTPHPPKLKKKQIFYTPQVKKTIDLSCRQYHNLLMNEVKNKQQTPPAPLRVEIDSSMKISLKRDDNQLVSLTKLENKTQKLNYKEIKYLGHEMEAQCDVCLELYGNETDKLINCTFCGYSVHQKCYRSELLVNDYSQGADWYCERCRKILKRKLNAFNIRCKFCPELKGIMKQIRNNPHSNEWAHISCVNWLPSIFYDSKIEKIQNYQSIKPEKFNNCNFCKIKHGNLINCNYENCQIFFHVTCAQQNGIIRSVNQMKQVNQSQLFQNYVPIYCQKHLFSLNRLQFNEYEKIEKKFQQNKQKYSYKIHYNQQGYTKQIPKYFTKFYQQDEDLSLMEWKIGQALKNNLCLCQNKRKSYQFLSKDKKKKLFLKQLFNKASVKSQDIYMFDKELQKNFQVYCKVSLENAQKRLVKFVKEYQINSSNASHSTQNSPVPSPNKVQTQNKLLWYLKRKNQCKSSAEKQTKKTVLGKRKRANSFDDGDLSKKKYVFEPSMHKNLKVFNKIIDMKIAFELKQLNINMPLDSLKPINLIYKPSVMKQQPKLSLTPDSKNKNSKDKIFNIIMTPKRSNLGHYIQQQEVKREVYIDISKQPNQINRNHNLNHNIQTKEVSQNFKINQQRI